MLRRRVEEDGEMDRPMRLPDGLPATGHGLRRGR